MSGNPDYTDDDLKILLSGSWEAEPQLPGSTSTRYQANESHPAGGGVRPRTQPS